MNKLGQKSLRTLEFPIICGRLAEHAVSAKAKQLANDLLPTTDFEDASLYLQQTTDAKAMMERQGGPTLNGIREVGASLRRTEVGGVLNLRELLDIASLLQAARLMQGYFAEQEEKTTLTPYWHQLAGNRILEERITTSILNEEDLADGASGELSSIRRQMRQISGKVRDTLGRFLSGERAKYLQETIITQRNGRFVVPVKAEHRGDVPGMVHDTSGTGATIFVEPAAVVEINNQLKILQGKEAQEIERILREISAMVGQCRHQIAADYDALCALDFIFARAKLSYAMNATAPELVETGYLVDFKKARHPLLDPKIAVPIDIAIGQDYDTLVITGPNTGGKTVSLKTLGLLCLMVASGLHVPCSELSRVSLFEHVYADIGDEQSIEQSLSTFSSHMKTIVGMMETCGQGDLVLFDELGAGTDPVEGAALAVSVIGYARQMGARVAATTHYSELKTFALTTDGVENASCEFNVATLRPTYHLLTGIPGKSNAFAIAARLGLQPTILERAKDQLSSEDTRFEDVLAQLEKERRRLEQYKMEVERLRSEAQSARDKAEHLHEKTEDQVQRILDNARAKADTILKDARMTAETVFDEIDTMKKQAQQDVAGANLSAARAALRGVITQSETELHRNTNQKRTVEQGAQRALVAGDQVRLLNMSNVIATVLAPAKGGMVQVQAGIMKMNVKENEVRLEKQQSKPKQPRRTGGGRALKTETMPMEVDVRGYCAEEAILEVDQFISSAIMHKLPSIRIIHGKGTGVLRAAIQKHLKSNKFCKVIRNGAYGEGEHGVTVVEF